MTSPECELYLAKSENANLSSMKWATMGGGEDYLKRKLADISYCFLHARHSSGPQRYTGRNWRKPLPGGVDILVGGGSQYIETDKGCR